MKHKARNASCGPCCLRNCCARRLTYNAGSSVTNTYSYNRRRLLTAETMTPDTLLPARTLGYGYDRQGQVVVETIACAAGYNLRWLLRWIALFCAWLSAILAVRSMSSRALYPAIAI